MDRAPRGGESWPTPIACVVSFLSYAIWPPLALAAGYQFFDHVWEAAFVFGSFTAFAILPFSFLFEISDTTSSVILIASWPLFWLIPAYLFFRRPRFKSQQRIFILLLCGFSFAQSAFGLFMILTKHV